MIGRSVLPLNVSVAPDSMKIPPPHTPPFGQALLPLDLPIVMVRAEMVEAPEAMTNTVDASSPSTSTVLDDPGVPLDDEPSIVRSLLMTSDPETATFVTCGAKVILSPGAAAAIASRNVVQLVMHEA
jgi:hypothetical protein